MIDKAIPISLYFQITEELKSQINNGDLMPGERPPAESWMVERYNVSRVTIRKAITDLAAEGLVENKREHLYRANRCALVVPDVKHVKIGGKRSKEEGIALLF